MLIYIREGTALHVLEAVARLHSMIEAGFERLGAKMSALDDAIAALKDKVNTLTTVDQAAIALIGGIKDEVAAAMTNALNKGATPEQLTALTDLTSTLETQNTALANAVSANTPAASPTPDPAPEPAPEPPAAA